MINGLTLEVLVESLWCVFRLQGPVESYSDQSLALQDLKMFPSLGK